MTRRALALLAVVAAALVVAGCGGGGLGGDAIQTVQTAPDRDPAPEISVPALDGGGTVTLDDRDRPVILNFWASWCEPCTREMPALVEFATVHPELDVVGIAVNDRPADSRRFAEEIGIPFELGVDRSGDVAADFNVQGLPVTVVIDAEGRVASVFPGEIDREQLDAFAQQLGT
ncbi:TlpA family protein disulfide reductase [Miltoncostaea oceani]|jgi:cytochrome c biogenesis protein CcmG, thiol:disulfide interchange protein DsbE|uniref:TlpA family protein disulfide reductase n=1 Tax=Miltoncostaea oceani TaxID=2843216 RepID=UPI001C3D7DF9|nr:TlpA disulfide reductase family protein [Miltoncostaea oceani]